MLQYIPPQASARCSRHKTASQVLDPTSILLVRLFDAGTEEIPLVSNLSSTSIDELWTSNASGPCCVGAAVVGDVLTGTAVALLTSDARMHCCWPPTPPVLLVCPEVYLLLQLIVNLSLHSRF